MRFWVSWWTANEVETPFQYWVSGFDGNDRMSLCAVIDAPDSNKIEEKLSELYPDMKMRFCEARPSDYVPGDRFPGFDPLMCSLGEEK